MMICRKYVTYSSALRSNIIHEKEVYFPPDIPLIGRPLIYFKAAAALVISLMSDNSNLGCKSDPFKNTAAAVKWINQRYSNCRNQKILGNPVEK